MYLESPESPVPCPPEIFPFASDVQFEVGGLKLIPKSSKIGYKLENKRY